jgi:Translation initiation factor 2 (IF-2; GTPase)
MLIPKEKNLLLEHELSARELSRETLMGEISRKTETNLDKLDEANVLRAEILE